MRALAIDFGGRPVRSLRALRLALACTALACFALAFDRHLAYRAEADALRLAIDEQAAAGRLPGMQAAEDDDPKGRLKYAVRLRGSIDAPWEALFQAVEAIPVSDIAVLSFSTDSTTRDIVLAGDARDVGAMHLYTQQIGTAQALTQVYLATHQVQAENARHPVRFSINASWGLLPAATAQSGGRP